MNTSRRCQVKNTWFTFWRHKQTQCYSSCKSILLEKKIVKKWIKKKTSQPPPCLWVASTLVFRVVLCSFVLIRYSNFEILSSSIWSPNFWRLDVDTKKLTVDLQVAMTTWTEVRDCSLVPRVQSNPDRIPLLKSSANQFEKLLGDACLIIWPDSKNKFSPN